MSTLSKKRIIFVWALRLYLLHLSNRPHISTNIMIRAIIEMVDNFVILQNNGKLENNTPGIRWHYATELQNTSKKLSQYFDSQ